MLDLVCALPILSALFTACAPPPPYATGYVEGDYVLVAPVASARIERVAVRRGDHLAPGGLLAEMERRDAEIALAQAEAALAEARARLADLDAGSRPEEIRRMEALLASAEARLKEARRTEARLVALAGRGAATAAQRDDAVTAAEVAAAEVKRIEAELALAREPVREHQREAARAAVKTAEARRDAAAWALDQRRLVAPAAGEVFDVIRVAGEIAGPAAPVISFLPDGAALLRLYAPETEISRIAPGDRLNVFCDGCGPGLTATVSWISDAPEFTPPVIYSLENRQTLVYQIEARPDPGAAGLRPGQIVDVRLPGDAQ